MAAIKSETVTYQSDGVSLQGYIAWDSGVKGRRPGVLVVHEWWGNNDYTRRRADMLAELGYTGFALDMYGEGKTVDNPKDAQTLMQAAISDKPSMRARFNAALAELKKHPTVAPDRIAAIGYCMGGGIVLHMARYGTELAAVASFHGSLPMVTARVVAYNGEADSFVSAEAIAAFKAEMEKAGADWQFISLPGALHGFSNPEATGNGERFGLPLKYNAVADESSWAHLRLTLESVFAAQ